MTDTIFALSSGAPPAAIAIVRVSGPSALAAAEQLVGSLPEPRIAALRTMRDTAGGVLDRALVVVFPGLRSATGEDLVEFHLHGGRAVVRAVEGSLAGMPGLRPAQPGEFTRRALTNGRIDLTEAEGLGDLLAAETDRQRRAALSVSQGAITRLVERWRGEILALAASIEADIDFSDEDEVPATTVSTLTSRATRLGDDLTRALDVPTVERLRDGLRIVIAGPPNAGKSTLLNAMADRDAAIVSPISGTTRDRIEVPVIREGIAFVLTDTAGLTDSTRDPIEAIGVARASDAMRSADLIVWLGDEHPPVDALWLHARSDLPGRTTMPVGPLLSIAAATGLGVETLWQEIVERSRSMLPPADCVALNQRQHDLVTKARDELLACAPTEDLLVIAEHIRGALRAFDHLTGQANVETMLDTLFGRFCIGK
jgi:tRNA modification GTPase